MDLDGLTASAALSRLRSDGWTPLGEGDWAWVLAGPSGGVARVTPFDPAYRLFAAACMEPPLSPLLPRIDAVIPLVRDGYVVFMEQLLPVEAATARDMLALLSPDASPPDAAAADLRFRIRNLSDEGAAQFSLWGGLDLNPRNVMSNSDGALKLVDPVYLSGPKMIAALEEGRVEALADFTRSQLLDFLTIPAFCRGDPEHVAQLRAAVDRISPPFP